MPHVIQILLTCVWFCLVGILENFIASINTQFRIQRNTKGCVASGFIMVIIWCYVVDSVANDLKNVGLIITYAIGYSYGEVLALQFSDHLYGLAKKVGIKLKRKKRIGGKR